jgi:hypothetical protein
VARLFIHVEGRTEKLFVNEILRDHLVSKGYYSVEARILGNARQRDRGGIRSWLSVKKEIMNHLREDPFCIATTMVDYYALPRDSSRGWPGRESGRGSSNEKARCVQEAIHEDLATEMGGGSNSRQFVPFIVMHEFEALLFSDRTAFSRSLGRSDLEASLHKIRGDFTTPEDINDSPVSSPSKRIEALVPSYQKPLQEVQAVRDIGLVRIRQECPNFNAWITQLESRVL